MFKGGNSACRAKKRDGYRSDWGRGSAGNNPRVLCIIIEEF